MFAHMGILTGAYCWRFEVDVKKAFNANQTGIEWHKRKGKFGGRSNLEETDHESGIGSARAHEPTVVLFPFSLFFSSPFSLL